MGLSAAYAYALATTLAEEGGYSDHASDPGGRTMRGITQRRYDEHRVSQGLVPQDVTLISETELGDIYRTYWDAVDGDSLPSPLAVVAFDVAVNSGPGRAKQWLAEGYGTPGVLTSRRLLHYADLETWPVFSKGWARRAARVLAAAEALNGNQRMV